MAAWEITVTTRRDAFAEWRATVVNAEATVVNAEDTVVNAEDSWVNAPCLVARRHNTFDVARIF